MPSSPNGPTGHLVLTALVAVLFASASHAQDARRVHPKLQQVVGYYTGAIGQVDDAKAHELLEDVAASGDPLARMWLARCYSRGRMGFDRDAERAREIAAEVIDAVRALAQEDVGEAAFLMGTAYAEGLGVESDEGMAIAWYARGADLDNALAAHNLANAYRAGQGVPQDVGMAAYWFRRAASQGDALTAYWLAQLYEGGQGVEQSAELALHWYRVSAERGNERAREAVARLEGS